MDKRPTKTTNMRYYSEAYVEIDVDHWPRYLGFVLLEPPANPAGKDAPAQYVLPELEQSIAP